MTRLSYARVAAATLLSALILSALPSSDAAAGLIKRPKKGVITVATLGTSEVAFDSNRTGNYEIFVMASDGTNVRQLTSDPSFDSWWPKISPDRTKLMFVRTPPGVHDTDYKQVSTWVMNIDGSNLQEILPHGSYGWVYQGHPEWSPDGTEIVTMCHGEVGRGVQVCIVNADGTNPRMVTNRANSTQIDPFQNNGGRGGVSVDPSWSPDGQWILFIGCPVFACVENEYELYRIHRDGTQEERLTFNAIRDHDAYYSPDGTTIAYLKNSSGVLAGPWGIYKIDPSIHPTPNDPLSYSPEIPIIDDGSINSKPGWALDSDTIWFHRWTLGTTLFNIWTIRKDGTGLREVITPVRDPLTGRFGTYDNEFPVNSSF